MDLHSVVVIVVRLYDTFFSSSSIERIFRKKFYLEYI